MSFFRTMWQTNKLAFFGTLFLIFVTLLGIFADVVAPFDPTATDIRAKFQPWSAEHWLGTDNLGRDILSRLIFGIRYTLFYALLAMALTLLIGVTVGVIAGLKGGKLGEGLMRLCDVVLAFPAEIMILAIVGMLGAGIEHILLAVVLVKWAWYARMVRGIVQQYRHQGYVLFAQTIQTPFYRVAWRHILPLSLAEVVVLASSDIGGVILMISALSFLGLGVQAPTPEWGVMLADAKNALLIHPEQMLPAGVAMVLVVMAFNGLGDFWRDQLNRQKQGFQDEK